MEYSEANSRASCPAICKCSLFHPPQPYVLFRQRIRVMLFPRKAPLSISLSLPTGHSNLKIFRAHPTSQLAVSLPLCWCRCERCSHRTGIIFMTKTRKPLPAIHLRIFGFTVLTVHTTPSSLVEFECLNSTGVYGATFQNASAQNRLFSHILSKHIQIKMHGTTAVPIWLYACEIWPHLKRTMIYECKLMVKGMSQANRGTVTGGRSKLHNSHTFFPPNIVVTCFSDL
jgi:hypothetical protein